MKKTLQLTTLSLITLSSIGQTTINGPDINPSVGESISLHSADYVSPGNPGANQTWDLSGLSSTGTSTTTVGSSSTNGANIVFLSGGAESHYNITSSAQELKELFTGNTTITYSDGEKSLQFPMSLNDVYSDDFYASYLASGVYPTVRSGSNTLEMDGYGTLILPSQTITDVIRVHYQQDYTDTYDFGTLSIINTVTDTYIWIKAGFKSTLASVGTSEAVGQTTYYASYTATTNVGIDKIEGVEEVKINGNPFNDNLLFSVRTNSNIEVNYQIVDVTGSVIYNSVNAMLLNGNNEFTVSTSNLSSGIYALKITSGNSTISKLILKG